MAIVSLSLLKDVVALFLLNSRGGCNPVAVILLEAVVALFL